MSHRQWGHLETALPFTILCEGREASFSHRSHRESNPRLSRGSPLHNRCATPAPLYIAYVCVMYQLDQLCSHSHRRYHRSLSMYQWNNIYVWVRGSDLHTARTYSHCLVREGLERETLSEIAAYHDALPDLVLLFWSLNTQTI